MAITLIPHTYSIEVQLSDYTLSGYYQYGMGGSVISGQLFWIEQELEDSVYISGYKSTLQKFYVQLYTNNEPRPSWGQSTRMYLYIPENTPLHFYIYPCRPNTQYVVHTGVSYDAIVGTVTTLPETTEYNRMYDVSDSLSFDQSVENVELIRGVLDNADWTPEAIAGVLGVMYCQSGVNPANIGYHYDGTPYSVDSQDAVWCTATTLMRADCQNIPYQTDITQTPNNPYWIYGIKPSNVNPTIPTWSYVGTLGHSDLTDLRSAISLSNGGFGLLGIMPFDRYLLFPQSTLQMFPYGNYWSGESQVQWLLNESRFNYYWEYSFKDNFTLQEDFRSKTFTEYTFLKQTPETMAHIFLSHKADYLAFNTSYAEKLACAKQWARYFYKPKLHKRHKMPLWEYLRYTV